MNVVWFRTDLRLADHPALTAAMQSGQPVVALFVLNPEQHEKHGEAPQKFEFIKAHINDLIPRLAQFGVSSWVHEVPTFAEVPPLFERLIETHEIKAVHWHRQHWPHEIARDQAVAEVLDQAAVALHQHHSNYLLPPGHVRKNDGGMYHVFTPYKHKFIKHLKAAYAPPLPLPKAHQDHAVTQAKPVPVAFELADWPIGEPAVAQRVKDFCRDQDYAAERDYPAVSGTSGLSPYLAIGVISARQCLGHALKQDGEPAFTSTWVSELIWRDFYHDLMHEYPRLAKHQPFKADAVDHWVDAPDLLAAWEQGQTGFPIVDAGMRQLLQTGWMHNRVRMIVASFLTKLCLVDWRAGEAHFMAHLLDGDLASNNGGWQWSSATGCDAAPYFRIFNPTTQSEKFDPDGTYIRQWVPELAAVPGKEIHNPQAATRDDLGYPPPIIDYKAARQQALDWFKR
ncbi:cryptochrome/photolyase family protein [Marinicella meishanensis]|uniref:cryptochrome/photolyase family protein n=1 Tax=Marinicella meishanensis TaxID=2873263 RepID=UPI001CBB8D02|nr:FAD-binding domain-containing protein [Marinicella sp. NBU2979]